MSFTETITTEDARSREGNTSLVTAIAERGELQEELYLKFRRPLMQVFLQRRIDRDAAQDLLQRTFLQAIKKIRAEGLDDPSNLGGYLYRTATKLAAAYWRGELARQHDNDRELLTNLKDETLSLEERLDHDILARSVRELIDELPGHRDREVLERFYLREESRASVCESLNLTSLQFNQVLWRARQRFGEVLRKHGLARGSCLAAHASEGSGQL
jgi:RNA polymerase sigma factor (sigma-70 family)